ncbi:MAG: LapA family protein [Pseudomonadota bacterium]
MRYFSWIITIPLAVIAVLFAISNRDPVTLDLWPLPFTLTIPIFIVVLAAIVVGFLAGGLVAWMGSSRYRRAARRERARADALRAETKAAQQSAANARRQAREASAAALPAANIQGALADKR